ncbi:MAG: methyltransferase domain-containing protein [Chloroflexota bacterium]
MSTTQYKASQEEESQRYSRRNILRSEYLYEQGFQSPGGTDFVKTLCQRVDIEQGHHVLEIGSGLGGTTFYLAETYDASILGLDISEHMIALSRERQQARGIDSITFQQGDIVQMQPPLSTFDLAWTQDCLLYVSERPIAWRHIYQALKPGGQLLITDFCRGTEPLTKAFEEYVTTCGYYLEDIPSYAQTLRDAQFIDVVAEDITDQFIDTLKRGHERILSRKEEFLNQYSQDEFDYLLGRWDTKIEFCEIGDFRWGLFIARK